MNTPLFVVVWAWCGIINYYPCSTFEEAYSVWQCKPLASILGVCEKHGIRGYTEEGKCSKCVEENVTHEE